MRLLCSRWKRGSKISRCQSANLLKVLIITIRFSPEPDIPLLLNRVYPCHEVVKVDYFLPGCPPSADAIWAALTALLSGEPIELPYELLKYD